MPQATPVMQTELTNDQGTAILTAINSVGGTNEYGASYQLSDILTIYAGETQAARDRQKRIMLILALAFEVLNP